MTLRLCVVLFACFATSISAFGDDKKSIVLIAGMKSHGPEGNGVHDYAWSARLLKTMLEHSNVRDKVNVQLHLNGWPSDLDSLRSADSIMIISDGRDGDKGREAPHLASVERIALMDRLVDQGCGVVTFHFSTFAPDSAAENVLNWNGGYFDWETDGRRDWYSDIKTVEATVSPAVAEHPVLEGVATFGLREEFYYDIRFRPNDTGWTPIWQVDSLPAEKPHGTVVSWAVQRPNGSRGFGTTCGHFYDNWEVPGFRKTLLNALIWTAHLDVPADGVESRYFSHQEIAEHLQQPDLVSDTVASKEYAEQPYWYQPGHPANPAETAQVETLPGFRTTRIYSVPEEYGSWTALCRDDRSRLIAAAQHQAGLYRVTPPALDSVDTEARVEKLQGVATQVGWSQGLLHAFDSLYVTVNDADEGSRGLYRLRDTNQDDQFDKIERIIAFSEAGEHSAHNLVVGPSGEWLYMIWGNGTRLPEDVGRRRPVATKGDDHLMPPEFGNSRYTPAGFVVKFRPDGSEIELVSAGLRNSFDLAFNRRGDLFTFDSDMEWDLGTPWYRPTRICHLVSGAEFGWRGDAAKWPEHYEDSTAPVINVGPASPSGVTFGHTANFPTKYRNALFACDWTFATIHAVHLTPHGASYQAEIEEFVGGRGLPVTDVTIGGDGAMYFAVGGRRLGSALYRVTYEGDADTSAESRRPDVPALHRLRRQLETFHGQSDPKAVESAWTHLGSEDRSLRFAARVAIESQPVERWRDRALKEANATIQLTALLALARLGSVADLQQLIHELNSIDLASLEGEHLRRALRVYEVALARGAEELSSIQDSVRQQLRPHFPRKPASGSESHLLTNSINRELSRLLCYLQDANAIDAALDLMADDGGERTLLGTGNFTRNPKYGQAVSDMLQSAPLVERMHHAQMLTWIAKGWSDEQRQRYFELTSAAVRESRGGHGYGQIWARIGEAALANMAEQERDRYAELLVTMPAPEDGLPTAEGPGREWTLGEALELLRNGLAERNFEQGAKMFRAAKCVTCHRIAGQGSSVGPDLTTLGSRFTLRDILDSTVNPSKAVSDQYRVSMIAMLDGQVLSGRVISRDANEVQLATNLMRPSQSTSIPVDEIDEEVLVPVSTMPTKLLDALNGEEVLDLLAFLIASGNPNHAVFAD